MNDVKWLLEHAEATAAPVELAWRYWTDVRNWSDPPATFVLEGPFQEGTRGSTLLPDRQAVHWTLRDVRPGRGYTLESDLDGALLVCQWTFDPLAVGGTRLTQRIGVTGPGAERHAEAVRKAFEPTLAAGMERIARQIAGAAGPPES
jgi:Polyketide cyclase / dehydrase and lipid transport